nr:family 1 glycosylhydrolase [Formosa haliotis]
MGLGYPTETIPGLKRIEKYVLPGDDALMPFDFDFIGVQYYFKVVAKFSLFPPILFATEVPAAKRNVNINAMDLEIYPKGLYKVLQQFNQYQQIKAIYITESGICFEDELEDGKILDKNRISYFKKTFKYTLKAIENNIPVQGYFFWTLVDNFEWAEGIKPRFGLFYTNFKSQERIIKKSGLWLKSFLKKR